METYSPITRVICQKHLPNPCDLTRFEADNIFTAWHIETDLSTLSDHLPEAFSDCAPLINPRGATIYPYSHKQQLHFWVKSHPKQPVKPWFIPPQATPIEQAVVIGGGIAGACVAYALARRGIAVQVLEAQSIAHAASGNYQGLLYAQISPHDTPQSQLLLQSYAHAVGTIRQRLPVDCGNLCGVLQLDRPHSKYRQIVAITSDLYDYQNDTPYGSGLFWHFGGWLNPPSFVHSLLDHPLITVREYTPVDSMIRQGHLWRLNISTDSLLASHVVLCCGANFNLNQQFGVNLTPIAGQTEVVRATDQTQKIVYALSGESYIAPAWQGKHCLGASFHPNINTDQISECDRADNLQAAFKLNSVLHHLEVVDSHAAVRVDSFDHLPVVGALGDFEAMKRIYATLALDKNYPINTPCPYQPGLYISSAHGTRGMLTAPLCGEEIAAQICGEPSPLGENLQAALNPNRLLIRNIVRHRL